MNESSQITFRLTLTVFTASTSTTPTPTLLTLPANVLTRILDYLLSAADVRIEERGTYGREYTPDYTFSTAILPVNKELNALGEHIFERNNFVLVSCDDGNFIDDHLDGNRVWHRFRSNVPFAKYHLRLQISKKTSGREEMIAQPVSFILPAECLPNLVWAMRLNTGNTQRTYEFVFDLLKQSNGMMLPHKVQESLLRPFMKLISTGQRFSIDGSVDESIATRYRALLNPSVQWWRAYVWETIDVLEFKFAVAHQFTIAGDYIGALSTYGNVLAAYQRFELVNSEQAKVDDMDFCLQAGHARLKAMMNIARLFLKAAQPSPDLKVGLLRFISEVPPSTFELPHVSSTVAAMLRPHVGYTIMALGDFELGMEYIKKASKSRDPEVAYVKDILKLLRQFYDSSSNATYNAGFLDFVRVKISKAMLDMPEWSKILPEPNPPEVCSLDYERYVLRGLGYGGDLLEDKLKQREGWSADLVSGKEVARPFSVDDAEATLVRVREVSAVHQNNHPVVKSLVRGRFMFWGVGKR